MMCTTNEAWINDTYYRKVGFIQAKQCKFNKANFEEELKKELESNIVLKTEICEGYYRICKSEVGSLEEWEFGEYHYKPCKKGKGATLYYYAAYEILEVENVKCL